jgi:hypothetical protein
MPETEEQDLSISTHKSGLKKGRKMVIRKSSSMKSTKVMQHIMPASAALLDAVSLCNAIHETVSIHVIDLLLLFPDRILHLPPIHISGYLKEKSRP